MPAVMDRRPESGPHRETFGVPDGDDVKGFQGQVALVTVLVQNVEAVYTDSLYQAFLEGLQIESPELALLWLGDLSSAVQLDDPVGLVVAPGQLNETG